MAKTSYLGSNVSVSGSTFRNWIDRTNQMIYDMGTVVMTVAANSTGEVTSGNAVINGVFSAQTLVAIGTLRGGTVSTSGNLTIGSNVVIGAYNFESAANTIFSNNVLVNATLKVNAAANVTGAINVGGTATISGNLTATATKNFGAANTLLFTENSSNTNYGKFFRISSTGLTEVANITLDNLSDVDAASPTNGYFLGWDGSKWTPTAIGSGGSFSANTLSGNTVAAERFVQLGQLSLIGNTGFAFSLTVNTTSNTTEIVIKNTPVILNGTSTLAVGGNTIPASYIFGVTGNTHANGSVLITGGIAVGGNVSATAFVGALTGTAANATLFNNQPGSFYTNASNISTGTLPEAQLPYRMNQNVRTTDAVTFSNVTFTGTLAGNVSETSLPYRMNQNVRSSDNVSFNVVTATLYGNANTATQLASARTISISGDVVGNVSFNGTANVDIVATIQPNSVALGTDTTGNYVATIASTGTGLTVSGSGSESAGVTIGLDSSANVSFNIITAALYGTANNASALNNQPASYYTNATNIASGTVPTARLGSGTANSTTILVGDSTWKSVETALGYTPLRNTANTYHADSSGIVRFYFDSTGKSVYNSTGGHEWRHANTAIGNLYSNGTFVVTGDVNAYSDERMKKNLSIISTPLEKVKAISGYNFTWNNAKNPERNGSADVGLIAQEIEKIMPEAVHTDEKGLLVVSYNKIIPLLVEAVKELSEKVHGNQA